MSKYYIYILKCSDNTYYTGWTTDVTRRINEHNSGDRGAKYTHGRRPVYIVYTEEFVTENEARKREYAIKQMTRRQKEGLISCMK